MSPVPSAGYIPGSTTLTRRSYVECGMVPHFKAPMTPQHVSQMHLAAAAGAGLPPHGNTSAHIHQAQQQPRPGSSNTMTSDRISLGSGSDQFSVQSGGPRQTQQVQSGPGTAPQSILYVYPKSAACSRRSQIIQPHQILPSEAFAPVFYRQNGNSTGNLSASGKIPFYLLCLIHTLHPLCMHILFVRVSFWSLLFDCQK